MDIETQIEALLASTNRTESALAANGVLDELLEGGSALSPRGPQGLESLSASVKSESESLPFVLAVLVNTARWLGTWSRLDAIRKDGTYEREVANERDAGAALLTFVRKFGGLLPESKNAEVRSGFYRLLGQCEEPSKAVGYLNERMSVDPSLRARARAAEGLTVALARTTSPDTFASEIQALRELVRSEAMVAGRVALAPALFVGQSESANRSLVERILGTQLAPTDQVDYWPSELL